MSPSKITSSVFLLAIFLFSLQTAYGNDPIYYICSNSGNYATNDSYDVNLFQLKAYLSHQTTPTGFSLGSKGQSQSKTYGLGQCLGDTSAQKCKSCIKQASTQIGNKCPNDKAAIIWYDTCQLKYGRTDFFSKVDMENAYYAYNSQNASDPASFTNQTTNWLNQLAKRASLTTDMFVAQTLALNGNFGRVYGLVQCTRDYTIIDCRKCLEHAVQELSQLCYGRKGARFGTGSCNVRYETYEFVGV